MITIIYSTHKDTSYNNKFKQHLEKTIGIKEYEILEFQNNNQYSLANVYNLGLSQAKYDIIVCCHNDIKLENRWGKKLINDFDNNPEFGIIGKAGSCYFPSSGIYWERMSETMVGQVYHHPVGKNKWLNRYSPKLPFLIPVVTIDGLFIAFDKTKIKHTFDESFGRFHFYDHGFTIPNYLDGVKIGVTSSFEITHESVGQPNNEFFESKNFFLQKYQDKLPLDLKPTNVFCEKIQTTNNKQTYKVAVIIPTKGNCDMLFDCISSIIEKCNNTLFEIFIADTGSTDEEKKLIKSFIVENKHIVKINLLEYNYYNFAKINNDVVKNHVDDSFEFLLFCNNDIKVITNVIDSMLNVFKVNKLTGTVGARLHFGDNTIQHNGILLFYDKNQNLNISHNGFKSYYTIFSQNQSVIGNTAALMMIRKKTFIKCNMFNESYLGCLEDVELNLKCHLLGLKNILSSDSVGYHYESQTRKYDVETNQKFQVDFELLNDFILKNKNKLNNIVKTL